MNNKALFLLFLTLWLTTACDKKTADPGCGTVYESQQAFLDYWYFPEGSWWVYELKGSPGVYDTVRVTEQRSKYYEPCKKDCNPDYFTCTMTYFSTLNHSNKNYFIPFGGNNYPANESLVAQGGALRVISNLNDNSLPEETVLVFPIQIGLQLGEYHILADTNQVITPLQSFNQSVHIKVNLPPQADTVAFGNTTRSLFFTKHVGLTKRVYTGNQTWELVNYHINR